MNLPYYCKIIETPIKVVEENGERKYYAFDWKTGEFCATSKFNSRPLGGIGGSETDFDQLTKDEFEEQLTKVKNRYHMNKSIPFYFAYNGGLVKVIYQKTITGVEMPTFHVLNDETGLFEYNHGFRTIAYGEEGPVQYLSEEEFNDYVQSRIA